MEHIFSMTGYGKAVAQFSGKKFTAEIKCLNSKQTDINLRLPSLYKEKEARMREMLSETLQRGKIDLSLYCEITGPEKAPKINEALVKEYMIQLRDISRDAEVKGDIISAVMRLPDVMKNAEDEVENEEWLEVEKLLRDALINVMEFRRIEGERLRTDFLDRLGGIRHRMDGMTEFEQDRHARIREKLSKSLVEMEDKIDENRYEQELIYYLEKLDITEEKVRLSSHLDYFLELLNEGGAIGKKLGFLTQEIGREINTMGSKANHAQMQKLVVEMKDELEKIKEQVLNIL